MSVFCKGLFDMPDNILYMCGHSLGPMIHKSDVAVGNAMGMWSQKIVRCWSGENWCNFGEVLGKKAAQIIGANAEETIVDDSCLSMTLYKAIHAALSICKKNKKTILMEKGAFPTDKYIAQGIASKEIDCQVKLADIGPSIVNDINDDVGILLISHVDYRTGFMYDIPEIIHAAHNKGVVVIVDCSHSAGIVPLQLNYWNVDIAVCCTYKYLSGGPGSPCLLYVRQDLQSIMKNPIWGWYSHKSKFSFSDHYDPSDNITKFLTGTPPILSMKSLEGALDFFINLDIAMIRSESMQQSEYFIDMISKHVNLMHCISPANAIDRGGHVAFVSEYSYGIYIELQKKNIICDYRAPNVLRFCTNPLYLSQEEITTAVLYIKEIISKDLHIQHKREGNEYPV